MTAPTPRQPLLDVAGLRVTYGGVVAVSDVDLRITEGTIYGLIGPNGAGKTSMVDALTGYTRPAAGRITFNGRDIGALRPYRRARRTLRMPRLRASPVLVIFSAGRNGLPRRLRRGPGGRITNMLVTPVIDDPLSTGAEPAPHPTPA